MLLSAANAHVHAHKHALHEGMRTHVVVVGTNEFGVSRGDLVIGAPPLSCDKQNYVGHNYVCRNCAGLPPLSYDEKNDCLQGGNIPTLPVSFKACAGAYSTSSPLSVTATLAPVELNSATPAPKDLAQVSPSPVSVETSLVRDVGDN